MDAELAVRARPALPLHVLLWLILALGTRVGTLAPGLVLCGGVVLVLGSIARAVVVRRAVDRVFGLSFVSTSLCVAGAWGALGFGLGWSLGLTAETLIAWLAIAGIAAASTSSLSPRPGFTIVFITVLLLPIVVSSLPMMNRQAWSVGAIVFLYLIFLSVQARHNGRAFLRALEVAADLREQAVRLDDARRVAESASEARSAFLSTVGHELRTPLNGVLGGCRLLGEASLAPSEKHLVDTVQDSAERLLYLINQILDYTRLTSGGKPFEQASTSLPALIERALSETRKAAAKKGVTLASRLDRTLPRRALLDESAVHAVLRTLINNAIVRTASGEILVSLAAQKQDSLLRFEVRDGGLPLSEAEIGQLFQPFQRGSHGGHGGAGGLAFAMARGLVDALGGNVGCVAREGGCDFWFEVPLRSAGQDALVGDGRPTVLSMPVLTVPRPVLVAEDDRTNQLVVCAYLKKLGYEPHLVGDGAAAVEEFPKRSWHAVLLDCHMPIMTGWEAAARIRAVESEAKRVRIIAISAGASEVDRQRCWDAGVNEWLSKPLRIEELASSLAKV